jgi:hypothetical protein
MLNFYDTSPLVALLHFYTLLPMVSAMNGYGTKLSPSLDDCRGAVNMIPTSSLIFNGQGGLSWTIEAKAHKYKSLPAKFIYRSCSIEVAPERLPYPSNSRSPKNLARATYFHAWPAVKAAVERE